ncbi:50S ribosomal protein L10 [Candidatus Uhrbacteria bacterium CG_4_9_14_3_um_filter_36_7]|uniref:Large ribosomal subunit protein uL10 n=1 Tax=Candidatus Uhrbacteria bacterium CG_4_9_14_3_um_filter_36_7 TaxID=1975033 RepID=A0A2M7XGS3_9BACT|nr:MAG: 50S ribosomal protein L10 [Candidatus Uhrbacteria bacterium CG_4_9_14_3_um_filter_36_7]
MPKTRAQKEQMIEGYVKTIEQMKAAAIVSVYGYTMEDADELRKKGKEAGVKFVVAKKTLMKKAIEDAGITGVDPLSLTGSHLWAFGLRDEVSAAKCLCELAKKKETIQVLGGILEQVFIDADGVKRLSDLPSKQELLTKLVGSLESPIRGVVQVLAGNIQGLVRVLHAVKEQKS